MLSDCEDDMADLSFDASDGEFNEDPQDGESTPQIKHKETFQEQSLQDCTIANVEPSVMKSIIRALSIHQSSEDPLKKLKVQRHSGVYEEMESPCHGGH